MVKQLDEWEKDIRQNPENNIMLDKYGSQIKNHVIASLETFIGEIKESQENNSMSESLLEARKVEHEIKDALNAIFEKISSAREELSAISMMAKERDIEGFGSVEDELSAIVYDTEQATNKILDSADEITEIISDTSIDEYEKRRIIQNKAMDIVLACSFQDITGQRVQKVVEVIQLIDSKIGNIQKKLYNTHDYNVSGDMEDFSRASQKQAGLLNGPALPSAPKNESIDQSDIDSLFD